MADDSKISRLRARYRPGHVSILLVGESAPAGGTHYYLANSNLFHGVRQAVRLVHGDDTPDGEEFLKFAKGQGIWLVDLASQPVDRLAAAERRRLTELGITRVAGIIRRCQPDRVVAVKMSLEKQVQDALIRSGVDAPLDVLHFPGQGWQNVFIEELVSILSRAREAEPNLTAQQ